MKLLSILVNVFLQVSIHSFSIKECSVNDWNQLEHFDKAKLYDLIMPIFVLSSPSHTRNIYDPDDTEIYIQNIKRYSLDTDEKFESLLNVKWSRLNELFGRVKTGNRNTI